MRIDQVDLAFEVSGEHVLGQGATDRAFFGARPNDRHRAWSERVFEITDCHCRFCTESSTRKKSCHSHSLPGVSFS
jgi:hypothetical protein